MPCVAECALSCAYPEAPGAGAALLPDELEVLLPLGPVAVALLPVPVALVAVPPVLFCVPADEPPVPSVEALTPLPAVALPPLPDVLELPAALLEPPVLTPLVLVVLLLCALRTPVPPSAWRPAANPLLSVVLVLPEVTPCAYRVVEAASAMAPASRVMPSLVFIIHSPHAAHGELPMCGADSCHECPIEDEAIGTRDKPLAAALFFQARRAVFSVVLLVALSAAPIVIHHGAAGCSGA